MKKNAVLFGASTMGMIAYEKFKDIYNIVFYTDNDRKKWGKKIYNIEVISPNKLTTLPMEFDVIITSSYDVAIAEQLIKMGIKKFGVYESNINDIVYYNYDYLNNLTRIKNKITLIMMNNSGCNTYCLYKMIPEKIRKKYKIALVNENNKNNNYYLDLIQSELIVRDQDGDYNESQKNIQIFHGFPLKGISNMSKYPKENKRFNRRNWDKLDAIISYSNTYSTFMNACYGVDGQKYVVTGVPRNDFLFKSKGKENLSKLYNLDLKNKNVIFYMPTFRNTIYGQINGDRNNFNILTTKDFNIPEFDIFLENINCVMIFKLHPYHAEENSKYLNDMKLKNIYSLNDDILSKANLDLYELLNSADLLITDYSSVYFDYLLLDRPIIFTPLDLDEYEMNRGLLAEPYDFWAPGPKCFCFKDLINEIPKCLNNPNYYKDERKLVCNIVHRYKDGNSSERVWNLIDQIMTKN